jgi:hypothetical protein
LNVALAELGADIRHRSKDRWLHGLDRGFDGATRLLRLIAASGGGPVVMDKVIDVGTVELLAHPRWCGRLEKRLLAQGRLQGGHARPRARECGDAELADMRDERILETRLGLFGQIERNRQPTPLATIHRRLPVGSPRNRLLDEAQRVHLTVRAIGDAGERAPRARQGRQLDLPRVGAP